MRDKIDFLVEESGSSHEEAELALGLANFNIEEALKILHTRQRDILVLRAKFYNPSPRLYGLMLLVAHAAERKPPVFRLRFIISDNPHLYETTLDSTWYEFEKEIYRARLSEWSYVALSQNLEREWERLMAAQAESLRRIKAAVERFERSAVSQWLENLMGASIVFRQRLKFIWEAEVMSLRDFRQTPAFAQGTEELPAPPSLSLEGRRAEPAPAKAGSEGGKGDEIFLILRTALADRVPEPWTFGGVRSMPISELQPGDSVFAYILETRDSAVYLAELFGGLAENGLVPIEVPVESVWEEEGLRGVRVRFGHAVVGEGAYPKHLRVLTIARQEV